MKKRNFVLTGIALGLSVLTTPMISQAEIPTVIEGQQVPSLAPMLEKVLPSVVSISVEGKQKGRSAEMMMAFRRNSSSSSARICLIVIAHRVILKALVPGRLSTQKKVMF